MQQRFPGRPHHAVRDWDWFIRRIGHDGSPWHLWIGAPRAGVLALFRARGRRVGGRGGRPFQLGDPVLEFAVALLQAVVALFCLDHVQGELLDFGQQLGLHFAQADTLLVDFRLGGDLGEVVVRLDVVGDFAQGAESVGRVEDVVRPAGVYDDFLGLDRAGDG